MGTTAAGNGKTILLVDDDPDFIFQQQVQLEAEGYAVISASSRTQAEALIADKRPDIAIVDLMMDEVDDGFTLCHHIKQHDATIPVIMLTGVAGETGMEFDASTNEERSWIKVDAYLDKPVRFHQLKGRIEKLLRG